MYKNIQNLQEKNYLQNVFMVFIKAISLRIHTESPITMRTVIKLRYSLLSVLQNAHLPRVPTTGRCGSFLFGISNCIFLSDSLFRFLFALIEGDVRFFTFSPSISAVVIDDKKVKYDIFESV